MVRKIPPDAFSYYLSLGTQRSYEAVARKYGVSKRAVTKLGTKEHWQDRLIELERKARQSTEQKTVETLEAIHERHLRAMRVLQVKGLEALKSYPLTTAMDAVRAIEIGVKNERLIWGEPSDRTAVSVEEIIKREYERWMVPAGRNGNADHSSN